MKWNFGSADNRNDKMIMNFCWLQTLTHLNTKGKNYSKYANWWAGKSTYITEYPNPHAWGTV